MNAKPKPLAEITQGVIEILCRELGIADAIRFLNPFTTGHGNDSAERDALLEVVTLDHMISEIKPP